jgi:hypothetical protein
MKRTLLDELLRNVEQITGERDLVMIGSQASMRCWPMFPPRS